MNAVVILVLVFNLILSGFGLYNTYKYMNADRQERSEIDKRITDVERHASGIENRVSNLITVSNKNSKTIQDEFSCFNEDMQHIIDRMEAAEAGIREVERDEREIRTYYMNYVSKNKVGFDTEDANA